MYDAVKRQARSAWSLPSLIVLAISCSAAAQRECQGIELNERTASRYRRLSKSVRSHSIFEENHFPSPCLAGKANCSSPMPEFWSGFCTFKTEGTWTDYMMCSPQKQAAIVEYYQSRRHIPGFAELLTFTPCDLWPVIRGRTLWLVGDSHMVDLFRALACAVGSFWDYNFKGDFPMAAEKDALEAMAEHVAHSTGPECLPLLEGTLVCLMRVNHGEVFMGHALPILERMTKPFDIAVVNFAAWHGAGANPYLKEMFQSLARLVEERRAQLPHIIWKEMVPTHWDQQHGLYEAKEGPRICKPLKVALQSDGTLGDTDGYSQLILEQGHENSYAREAFQNSSIIMTAFYNATVELFDFHRDLDKGRGHECSHYCFSGAPQVWVYYLYKAIKEAPWFERLPVNQ